MSAERTPVGVIRIGNEGVGVVCDDGSLWALNDDHREWRELPPVPGTERHVLRARDMWVAEFEKRFGEDLARKGGPGYVDFLVRLAVLHHGMKGESIDEVREILRSDHVPHSIRGAIELARDELVTRGWPDFVRERVSVPAGQ